PEGCTSLQRRLRGRAAPRRARQGRGQARRQGTCPSAEAGPRLAPRRPDRAGGAAEQRPTRRPRRSAARHEALAGGQGPRRHPRQGGVGETAGGGAEGVQPPVGRRGGAAEEDGGKNEMTVRGLFGPRESSVAVRRRTPPQRRTVVRTPSRRR